MGAEGLSLNVSNSLIYNNNALLGGALYAINTGNIFIISSLIYNNVASEGGAIFLNSCDVNLIDTNITVNFANSTAGGIYCNNSILWNTGLMFNNSATNSPNIYCELCETPDSCSCLTNIGLFNAPSGCTNCIHQFYGNNCSLYCGYCDSSPTYCDDGINGVGCSCLPNLIDFPYCYAMASSTISSEGQQVIIPLVAAMAVLAAISIVFISYYFGYYKRKNKTN